MLLARFLSQTYQIEIKTPSDKSIEHLAHVYARLGKIFPFNKIQNIMRKLVPVGQGKDKPGVSLLADISMYSWGWYEANPDVAKGIVALEMAKRKYGGMHERQND